MENVFCYVQTDYAMIHFGFLFFHCCLCWVHYDTAMGEKRSPCHHPMKQRIWQVLSDLPANSSILFTIGEIDCRLDEGIWSTAKKQAADYQTLIEKTVTGYLDWLEETLKKTSQPIIIQGIPAPNYHKELEMSDENVFEFLAMINEVNQQLKYYTLQKGWQFLDVYAATVAENGKSHGQWHLDSHHLKPAFYRQAQNWLSH